MFVSGAGTAYPSEHLNSPPVFIWICVTRSFICVFCRSLFVLLFFSFGRCVVCSSSIYGFWLPLWYIQTLLCHNLSTSRGRSTIWSIRFGKNSFSISAEQYCWVRAKSCWPRVDVMCLIGKNVVRVTKINKYIPCRVYLLFYLSTNNLCFLWFSCKTNPTHLSWPIMCLYVPSSVRWYPLGFPHKNDFQFVFAWSCLQNDSCHIYVICFCLRTVVSNTYCVVFLLCLSSSCVPYVASSSGLSIIYCPFGIL